LLLGILKETDGSAFEVLAALHANIPTLQRKTESLANSINSYSDTSAAQLEKSIANTTALMKQAAKELDFIQAAQYRDEIARLQEQLELK